MILRCLATLTGEYVEISTADLPSRKRKRPGKELAAPCLEQRTRGRLESAHELHI